MTDTHTAVQGEPRPGPSGYHVQCAPKARLIATRGLPGSAKSTRAKVWVEESPTTRARVNRDDLRVMLHGRRLGTPEQEKLVSVIQQASVREALRAGLEVIVDDTNLVQKFCRTFATIAAEEGAEFVVWDFTDVPLEECLRRDALREGDARVGEDVIRRMHERYVRPLKGQPFPKVWPFPKNGGPVPVSAPYVEPAPGAAPDAILVDLDGTVALMDGRSPYDWARVGEDAVNEPVRRSVLAMARDGVDVVFMSGRDEVCRPETEKWLCQHFPELVDVVLGSPLLFMRPEGDQRKDSVVKAELFDRHVRDRYRVVAVYDDRQQVVRMWRAMGLTVFQVAEGDF